MHKLTHKSDDERRAWCKQQGIEPPDHCCLDMAWFLSDPIEWESQGVNPVILYSASHREYRIDIGWRGHASTPIRFCPWCGTRLPESLDDVWYSTLYDMGYGDPGEDDIPAEFETDQWWKRRGL